MQCPKCGGGFEVAGENARCTRCLSIFRMTPQGPTPIQIEAPGGGHNQDFENMMAQNLGFGPPPQGAGRHNIPDVRVGDMNVRVKINGMSPERYAKDRASSMVWGWVIGGIIIGIMVIGGVLFGLYLFFSVRSSAANTSTPTARVAADASWDGKSTFTCDANDVVKLKGITATVSDVGVKAGGNCQLTLENVSITAPTGISGSGNAKITLTGGSITSTGNAVEVDNLSQVNATGTKVKGKVKKQALGKVTGIP